MEHRDWLARAIELADEGAQRGEGGPFGAVVVRHDAVLAEGWNQVTSRCDPTAHAEVVAIRSACEAVEDFALQGAVLYSSCEPCPMCLAACYWARLDRVYYANTRDDAAAIGFDDHSFYAELERPVSARSLPLVRIEIEEAFAPMRRWHARSDKTRY